VSDFALRCQGLVKRYPPDVVAVAGIDLEVRRGECVGLLGPNGAGKTTTVEILEGLTEPDEGSVELLGQRWGQGAASDRRLRGRLGVQLQETRLHDKLTVLETVRLFRSFHRRGRDPAEVVSLLGLESKAKTRLEKLSGGQRQRVALACALVADPELLFLDEPTTGLDPQARRRIWEVVERYQQGGGTVLLTTHYMEEAARLCDRVIIFDLGQVIAGDSPAALIRSLGAEQIVEVELDAGAEAIDLETLSAVEGVTHAELKAAALGDASQSASASAANQPSTTRLTFSVVAIGETLGRVLTALETQGLATTALRTHEATLEDVFVHLTGRGLRDD
jgi:ABC-2 type transport system ATP-binding protein